MNEKDDALSELLDLLSSGLDMPDAVYDQATSKYTELSRWLSKDHIQRFDTDASIYPQGSMRLGTIVMPVDETSGCDVDLVYLRELKKSSTTQERLKAQLGEQLRGYVESLKGSRETIPSLEDGRRCWTLEYPGAFHMDVLPAIPDEDGPASDAILIPDRDLRDWQHSNPKGYAAWFEEREAKVLASRLEEVAKAAEVEVERIPRERAKTPLRQTVRLLKRHRDLWCQGNHEHKPTSIIITTLAALAYSSEATTASALQAVVGHMEERIERRNGVYWIANPANPDENFADKWRSEPSRGSRFFEWLSALQADVHEATSRTGIHRIVETLSTAFGTAVSDGAARAFGNRYYETRTAGDLRMQAGSGRVGKSGQVRVPPHTNYGESG